MADSFPPSRLGYGCYGLGGAYGEKSSLSEAAALIHLAYDLGIRFFDTADTYGTEEILGRALRPFRNEVAIATKVGAGSGLSRGQIEANCEASLKKLGRDWIDLYQVHYDDPEVGPEEILQTLEDLKSQGKIRHYGIGHLPLAKTRLFLELGRPLTVLAEMNAAATWRYKELRPLQQDYDFSIIAFSVTGRGLLTGSLSAAPPFAISDIRRLDPLFKRSKLDSGLRLAGKMAALGRSLEMTPAQVAIAWVLNKPGVAAALTGPTRPEHLRENCAAAAITLDPAALQEIDDYIHQEEARSRAAIAKDIRAILHSPLTQRSQAKEDLIFVLEHAVENGLIPSGVGRDYFAFLMQPQISLAQLEDLKASIAELAKPSGGSSF
jgi:aryl-alcohol dehydrogenase-like predicted oxidoreductase